MKKIILIYLLYFSPLSGLFAQNATCPQPDYCDRECWAPGGVCPEDSTPVYTDVTHIIVHHSAANYSADQDYKQVVRSYWDYHVNTHGWDDIGYNWLVDPNGVIYEGRGKDKKGAHFSGANSNTMGVCVIGNYQTAQPTNISLEKLEDLIAWEAGRKNIDVLTTGYHSASNLTIYHVAGHRDGPGTTDCPGNNLYNLLPNIRTAVSQYPCYNGQASGPANDACENAIELVSHTTEQFHLATVDEANYESVLQKPVCDDFTNPSMLDVFFKFTAIENTHYIKVTPIGDLDPVVSLYQGINCNNLSEITCIDDGGGAGGEEIMEASGLVPGSTYTIRIYDYGDQVPDNPNFKIAVIHGSLNIDKNEQNLFEIYPNPVDNLLKIRGVNNFLSHLRIYTLNGNLIVDKNIDTKKKIQVNVETYLPGLYFVQLQDEHGNIGVYKFIKK